MIRGTITNLNDSFFFFLSLMVREARMRFLFRCIDRIILMLNSSEDSSVVCSVIP